VRTTLDLDDDVVEVARQLARQRKTTIGKTVSDLARQGLEPKAAPRIRNGVRLFDPKPGAAKPSLDLVNRLRDES
jgi:hypothetical protein